MSNQSYTNRDISAIRSQLIAQAKTLTSDWTDYNESDLGMVFVELMSGIADMLGFYLDKQALETFLPTVKQRKNGKGILGLIGYKFKMVTPCSTTGSFVLRTPLEVQFTIPRYTVISTYAKTDNRETINYCTAYDYIVNPGVTKFEIPLVQGTVHSATIRVSELPSNGKINLVGDNIAEGSVRVTLDGEDWEEVPDVILDDKSGKKFSVFETKDDKTYIYLHPDYEKYLPVDSTMQMTITYLDSLGPQGAISEEMLYRVETDLLVDGVYLKDIVSVNNYTRSSNGAYRETLDLARSRSADQLYTMNTAVVLDDYAKLARAVPGVLKAKAIDWSVEDSKYIKEPYKVRVYAIPENGYYLSDHELTTIKSVLDSKKISTITVECYNATYVDVDIKVVVHSNIADSKKAELTQIITEEVNTLFSKDKCEFGTGIRLSNLITKIEQSDSRIEYVDIITPTGNINLSAYEYPKLNSLSITITK